MNNKHIIDQVHDLKELFDEALKTAYRATNRSYGESDRVVEEGFKRAEQAEQAFDSAHRDLCSAIVVQVQQSMTGKLEADHAK